MPNPQLDGRIIGGIPANIIEVPYQVSIQNRGGHVCGGSVIHQSYILTAAHCLKDESISKLIIRAGSRFINKEGTTKRVCSAIKHANYKDEEDDYDYDVAILKAHSFQLCQDLVFNQTIMPIALPEYDEMVKVGTSALVSGWGYTNKEECISTSLQKVALAITNQTICRARYKDLGRLTGRMICAGCKRGVCDACQGDSGGPLVANGKLVGIVSWGYGCAVKDYPGVYSRVAKFRKWIRTKIRY
ncbi:Trypsin domain containing protein [Asbolus verrucosus]|uniref:Trypsin domain containing protein n=1 Tax=Asbolus verrucosus TaxID=1661398 RepID=A0A482VXL9_ASBVE|nr:Trypsin domain containing protein [Asbolus verrucosus]